MDTAHADHATIGMRVTNNLPFYKEPELSSRDWIDDRNVILGEVSSSHKVIGWGIGWASYSKCDAVGGKIGIGVLK